MNREVGMLGQITIADYSSDWALKERHVDHRTKAGYLTREEVIGSYGSLGIAGIELNHAYWDDYPAPRLKQLAASAGLPIVTYVALVDLAVPAGGCRRALDEMFSLLDRTAALGASRIFLIPSIFKLKFSLPEQRSWLIENLRLAAERAASMGITIMSENIDYPHTRPFMGRGSDCRDICVQVDSPAFRLIYDAAAHLFVNDDASQTFSDMFPYAQHVHLKNFRALGADEQPERFREANDGKRYTGTTLDVGLVAIDGIVAQLARLNYQGFLQIEYQGEDDPRIALKHNVAYLRSLLARLAPASGASHS